LLDENEKEIKTGRSPRGDSFWVPNEIGRQENPLSEGGGNSCLLLGGHRKNSAARLKNPRGRKRIFTRNRKERRRPILQGARKKG